VLEIRDLIEHFESGAKGEIVKTQSTYLDVVLSFQSEVQTIPSKFRIHFRGKREFSLNKGRFTKFQLFEKHPLLINFIEPMVTVHLASYVSNKEKFRSELEAIAYQIFNGWRSFEDYLNMPLDKFLEKSYGILMSAPKTFAESVVQMAERDNVKLIIHDYYKQTANPFVICFDENYVIADDFRVEALN